MNGRIIMAVAQQLGCGSAEVGPLVATRLGLCYADREILCRTARSLRIADETVACREDRPSTWYERLAGLLGIDSPGMLSAATSIGRITNERVFALEGRIAWALAEQQDFVVGRLAAACALRSYPGAVRVLLHAPATFRMLQLMDVDPTLTSEQATTILQESDGARREMMKRVGYVGGFNAAHYHLTLDTSTLPPDQAAELIVQYVRRRTGYYQRPPSHS